MQKPVETAHIKGLSHDGRGIAHIDGKVVFIDQALPGETVTFQYRKRSKNYAEGIAIDIQNPSADRVQPKCQHFSICGGCSLQHINHEAQLALKQNNLLEQLQHFGQVKPKTILPTIVGPTFAYRHKARLGVKWVAKKNKVLVGFREKSSHFLADLELCEVLSPPVGQLLNPLSQLIAQFSIKESIPQIEVAIGTDKTALIFRHLVPFNETDLALLKAFAQTHQIAIYLQPKSLDSIHLYWPNDTDEQITYLLPEYDIKFVYHPSAFAQVNPFINQQMIKQALELLAVDKNEIVLDLFCGFGNFTLPLAKFTKEVIGIEGNAQAVSQGTQNAALNHMNNVRFLVEDLNKPENFGAWSRQSYDKILLDPPRLGAQELLPTIADIKPKRIVYISCNPATLARDAGILVNQYQYQLTQVGIMDMFPQTSHVESMAVFEK
ncbi:MAG: 23S rRNA (uracil(1939)-C(5))-methyltransferase RlmD [Gammaproteobacteria bacterium]